MSPTIGELVKRLDDPAIIAEIDALGVRSGVLDTRELTLEIIRDRKEAARALQALEAENARLKKDRYALTADVDLIKTAADRRVEEEREACAQIAEHFTGNLWDADENALAARITSAIRARSNGAQVERSEDSDVTASSTAAAPIGCADKGGAMMPSTDATEPMICDGCGGVIAIPGRWIGFIGGGKCHEGCVDARNKKLNERAQRSANDVSERFTNTKPSPEDAVICSKCRRDVMGGDGHDDCLPQPSPAPDGWQLVPIEPLQSVLEAGAKAACDYDTNKDDPRYESWWPNFLDLSEVVYRAMLASAPPPPITDGWQQERERLREALEPFAEYVDRLNAAAIVFMPEDHVAEVTLPGRTDGAFWVLHFSSFMEAREALASSPPAPSQPSPVVTEEELAAHAQRIYVKMMLAGDDGSWLGETDPIELTKRAKAILAYELGAVLSLKGSSPVACGEDANGVDAARPRGGSAIGCADKVQAACRTCGKPISAFEAYDNGDNEGPWHKLCIPPKHLRAQRKASEPVNPSHPTSQAIAQERDKGGE